LAGCLRSCLCNAGRECCGGCACGGCNGRAGVGSAGHDPEKAAASGASSSTGLSGALGSALELGEWAAEGAVFCGAV